MVILILKIVATLLASCFSSFITGQGNFMIKCGSYYKTEDNICL